jgi:hypothetical protein
MRKWFLNQNIFFDCGSYMKFYVMIISTDGEKGQSIIIRVCFLIGGDEKNQ